VMLYQMLTGDRPFSGSPSTIMQKVLRQDPVEPSVLNPTLSAAWDTLIKRVLAKKPHDRLQSAREFAEWMRLAFEGKPLPEAAELPEDATVRIDATVRLAPPPQKRGRKAMIAVLAGLAAVAVAGAIALNRRSAPEPAPASAVAAAAPVTPPAPASPAAKIEPPKEVKAPPRPPKPLEKKAVKMEKPKPAPAPEAAKPVPALAPSRAGKVVSLDRNWGFLVVQSADPAVKVGDRLYANLADGRRVAIVVRRISGNLVSAIPEGQKISDEMLGATVTGK
jgi:hypothetical protein